MNILSILILIGAAAYFLFNWFNKQKENNENNIAVTIITAGIGLIAGGFGNNIDKIVDASVGREQADTNFLQVGIGLLLIFVGILMMNYVRQKETILNLLGNKERKIFHYRKKLGLTDLSFKENEVSLSRYAKQGVTMTRDRFDDAKEAVRDGVATFSAESTYHKRGYTGTASIPLTLYAGQCYKGGEIHNYYEYVKKEKNFVVLNKKDSILDEDRLKLTTSLEDMADELNSSSEVVLGVGITFKLNKEQAKQFNAPYVEYKVDEPKQNKITSVDQLKEYASDISDLINNLSGYASIKKIHLLLASQSCLPFELGGYLSNETYTVEVVNYQYIAACEPCYPWGVSFSHRGVEFVDCTAAE